MLLGVDLVDLRGVGPLVDSDEDPAETVLGRRSGASVTSQACWKKGGGCTLTGENDQTSGRQRTASVE
jgi:hypothetical protein